MIDWREGCLRTDRKGKERHVESRQVVIGRSVEEAISTDGQTLGIGTNRDR